MILGNPPFDMTVFEGFLARARLLLPDDGGRCGFLLPTNAIQTPSRLLRWAEHWSIDQRLVPRTLFPRSRWPLLFVLFRKGAARVLRGFALFRQAAEVGALPLAGRLLLVHGRPRVTCWRALVEWALRRCGGRASLRELYDAVEPHRPIDNRWWQEKVRQQLQRHFTPVERGVWSL